MDGEQFIDLKIDKFGFYFETKSFKAPRKIYRIDFNQLEYHHPNIKTYSKIKPILWHESTISDFNELEITTQYETYRSFDGNEVPLTFIKKKSNNDDKKPCLVHVYGGPGDCLYPRFDPYFLLFIELFNGVVGLYTIYFNSTL